MQSGCCIAFRRAVIPNLGACPLYVTQLPFTPPQLLRSLLPPKPSLSRRASTSSSSNSSSSTPTPPTRYEKRDSSTLTMDGGLKLQKILPALERVVPTLAPGRHKGQAGGCPVSHTTKVLVSFSLSIPCRMKLMV